MQAHTLAVVDAKPESVPVGTDCKSLESLAEEAFASIASFIASLAWADPIGVRVERVQEDSWCLKFRDHRACQLPDEVEARLEHLFSLAKQLGFEIAVSYTVLCQHQLFIDLHGGGLQRTIVAHGAMRRG